MASSGSVVDGVGVGVGVGENDGTAGVTGGGTRNPFICGVCHDYYNEPCLLSCFHTFCARCIRGPHLDGKVSCPICGQQTQLKDGAQLPPPDQLILQLVELTNSENPPCANCDKHDKSSMFFCTTCGQALCTHCRENTHRAKMFSTHEVVHMSKCAKDNQRRCPIHGEQYIMYSQSAKCMLCATCFRDTPADARPHCVDIESAWQQASKKMERAVNSICELQAGIRDGVVALKSQLDELRHSRESEQRALNTFCQGMQEVMTKTHGTVLTELQRQFESKERVVRGQLFSLGSALPVLQMHLMLCTAFTSGATKYQFLELAHPMLERLSRVAQLGYPSRPPLLTAHLKTNYRCEFARALQPFVGQSQASKESLYDQTHGMGQQEPPVIQSSKTAQRIPPKSGGESGPFSHHCRTFDTQLKELNQQLLTVKERLGELHRDVALLRRANTPPLGTRYDHVARDCRVLRQQLENHQIELERLKNVFDTLWDEQLCRIHIEKDIFHSQMNDILSLRNQVKQLQNLAQQLEPFIKSFTTGVSAGEVSMSASDAASNQQLQVLLEHLARLQMQEPPPPPPPQQPQTQPPTKEHRHSRNTSTSAADNALYMKESKEMPTRCRTPSGGVGAVLDSSGNIVVYGTAKSTDSKRGVLSQLMEKAWTKEDRKKSPGREEGRDRSQSRRSRKSPDSAKPKTPPGHSTTSKVRSLYRSLKGGSGDNSAEGLDQPERCTDAQKPQSHTAAGDEGEYQRISEASSLGEAKKRVQAQVHAVPDEQPLPANKGAKVYPASDPEDVLYGDDKASTEVRRRRRASCDSLSTTGSGSRRSSIADGTVGESVPDPRKTLVVLIGPTPAKSSLVQKQRSWETFPRLKSKRSSTTAAEGTASSFGQLKKADSFEGHEETVRTLVAAVQETRSHLRHHHAYHHRHHRKSKTN